MPTRQLEEWLEPLVIYAVEQRGAPGDIIVPWFRAWIALQLLICHCRQCPTFDRSPCDLWDKEDT